MSAETLVLVLRLLLVVVLTAAAAAKLADRSRFRETLAAFGVPARLATPGAILLPLVELAVAAALLPASLAWYGALAALALLALFSAAVAFQLARGRRPDCNCFGTIHAKPIGPVTLVRNGVLLGAAALAVSAGPAGTGPSALAWTREPVHATIGALALLAVIQAGLFIALLRRHGRLLARLDGVEAEHEPQLRVGTEAPEFLLPDVDGELVTLASLHAGGLPVLLLFSNPACGPCASLLPEVARWQREYEDELVVALVGAGERGANRAHAEEHDLVRVLLDPGDDVALAYGVAGTPMAVLVGPEGRIASELATGADAIGALVAGAVQPRTEVMLDV